MSRNSIDITLLCCALIFYIHDAIGQENSRRSQAGISAGYNFSSLIENDFSAKTFTGSGFGLIGSVEFNNSFHQDMVDIFYSQSQPSMSGNGHYDVKSLSAGIDYAHLYNVTGQRDGFNFAAGGAFNLFYSDRKFSGFLNRSKSHEFATAIGPAVAISYLFNDKLTGLAISNRLFVPVLSMINRPAFDESDNQTEFGSFSTIFRLKNKLWVEKNISPNSRLSVFYLWDFYRIDKAPQVRQAMHQAGAGYFIMF